MSTSGATVAGGVVHNPQHPYVLGWRSVELDGDASPCISSDCAAVAALAALARWIGASITLWRISGFLHNRKSPSMHVIKSNVKIFCQGTGVFAVQEQCRSS